MIYQSPIFDQRINNAFNVKSPEMVGHTLKSLQHLLQDFQSVPDHFETLYIKRVKRIIRTTISLLLWFKIFLHEYYSSTKT